MLRTIFFLQLKSNPGPPGQQHPVRMPTISSGAAKFNDPHALAQQPQLHQRSINAAADQSHNNSSAVQLKNESAYPTMDINAKKSPELDVQVAPQGLKQGQLPLPSSNAVGQETERSSLHIHGLSKQQQQHLHFPSAYGSSGGNYNPFSGTTSSSSSSLRPQPHDSHMRQIPPQSIGLNHVGGATQGSFGTVKLERQNSYSDPKRMPGGSVSPAVNNTASQQNLNPWQQSNEQNSGMLSSASYVKREPNDLSTEQQYRHHLSKLHGFPSVNSAKTDQGSGANQGTVNDDFSRGPPASTSMPHTTPASLMPLNSASSSVAQPGPTVSVSWKQCTCYCQRYNG